MSEHIHIEGMGLLGSMLARSLADYGHPFTWSDNHDLFNAWGASTSLAAPDGGVMNETGRVEWLRRADSVPEAEVVPFVFAHKSPPHEGRYKIEADHGLLRVAEPRAVALNAQEFVFNTREQFDVLKLPSSPPKGSTIVRCHPTPETTDGFVWGWSARASFQLPRFLAGRPALYAKAHRFDITYAYPSPLTDTWLAGSAMVVQQAPKLVSNARVEAYVETWIGNAELLLGLSQIKVMETYQGWRPRAAEHASPYAERHPNGGWVMPALGANGMRRGWVVVENLIGRAGWGLL